jgi:hypothetical protein
MGLSEWLSDYEWEWEGVYLWRLAAAWVKAWESESGLVWVWESVSGAA